MAWNIFFDNQTDQAVPFILYQENEILDENSYSAVWYKDEASPGERKGPIVLPHDVSVSIHPEDSAHHEVKPTKIQRGETWSYKSAGNHVVLESSDEDDPTASLENSADNKFDISVSLWKIGCKVSTQKKLAPGEKLTISVSPKIFVAANTKLEHAQEFQVLTLESEPAAYELESSDISIIAKKENGKIVFTD